MRKMTEVSLQEMSRDSLFSKKNNSMTNIVQSTADHSNGQSMMQPKVTSPPQLYSAHKSIFKQNHSMSSKILPQQMHQFRHMSTDDLNAKPAFDPYQPNEKMLLRVHDTQAYNSTTQLDQKDFQTQNPRDSSHKSPFLSHDNSTNLINNYSSLQSMPRLNVNQNLDKSYFVSGRQRRGNSTGLGKMPSGYNDKDVIEYLI